MKRKQYDAQLKAAIALEAIKERQTVSQIASHYGVHPNQVGKWKKQLLSQLPQLFADGRKKESLDNEQLTASLYQQIGQLKVELERLSKKLGCSVEKKRTLVDPDFEKIPVARQCQVLGLAKSSYYYKPTGESAFNLELMRLIDEQYIRTPFYGVPKITAWLKRLGYPVGPKRVRRLMRKMELIAIFPKPNTSKPGEAPKKYPYLLGEVHIERPNQVWSTDITYIRLKSGFVYLCAILDWFSRYVLSWELSNSQDVFFCLGALEKALRLGTPDIFTVTKVASSHQKRSQAG